MFPFKSRRQKLEELEKRVASAPVVRTPAEQAWKRFRKNRRNRQRKNPQLRNLRRKRLLKPTESTPSRWNRQATKVSALRKALWQALLQTKF